VKNVNSFFRTFSKKLLGLNPQQFFGFFFDFLPLFLQQQLLYGHLQIRAHGITQLLPLLQVQQGVPAVAEGWRIQGQQEQFFPGAREPDQLVQDGIQFLIDSFEQFP
jgi:hypothetical protein